MNKRIYIDYLEALNNFRQVRKYFNSEQEAKEFMLKTFDNFNPDCIKYE